MRVKFQCLWRSARRLSWWPWSQNSKTVRKFQISGRFEEEKFHLIWKSTKNISYFKKIDYFASEIDYHYGKMLKMKYNKKMKFIHQLKLSLSSIFKFSAQFFSSFSVPAKLLTISQIHPVHSFQNTDVLLWKG